MSFGKHTGSTFQQVWEADSSYCDWAIQTVEEDKTGSDGLKNFAAYVYHKKTVETYAADDFSMMEDPPEQDL